MSYYETYEQFNRDVLKTDEYYNTNIEGKFFVSEYEGIYEIVQRNETFRDMRSEKMRENNPMSRPEVREHFSKLHSGEGNPRYGCKNTPEHTEKIRQSVMRPVTDGVRTWESQRSYRQEHNIGSTRFYTLLRKGEIRYLDDPE